MSKTWFKVLMITTILLMSFVSPFSKSQSNAQAQQIASIGSEMNEVLLNYEQTDQQFEILTNKQIKKELIKVKKMINSDEIELKSKNKVEYNEAFGKIHIESKDTYIFVPFKVKDEQYQLNSAVIHLDENKKFVGIMEMDLKADKKSQQGVIKTWENGNIVLDKIVPLPEESFEVNINDETPEFQTFGLKDRWDTFSDCLNSQGVSYALITLAGAICGGACGATWGAGCAPCFYGLSFISGGVIGHCFQKALQ